MFTHSTLDRSGNRGGGSISGSGDPVDLAWAVDEKGAVKWGLEAARLNEQKALGNGEPKAKAKVEADAVRQRVRDNPTYEHSPRLLTLSNLEEWPAARKELAACLLQEATPNYEKSDRRRRGIVKCCGW